MQINNFNHDIENETIRFDVAHNGITNRVELESTGHGTQYTDIDDFANRWSDAEYQQLESFIIGCSEILHKFQH